MCSSFKVCVALLIISSVNNYEAPIMCQTHLWVPGTVTCKTKLEETSNKKSTISNNLGIYRRIDNVVINQITLQINGFHFCNRWRICLQCRSQGSIPGTEDSLEKEMAADSKDSCIRISWTETLAGCIHQDLRVRSDI